ncbi:MAG: TssQ family T6SS-associated lipoprotein [Pseudomonadota bacterium]|jgi:Tfp pilus assembly protein PilF
MSGISRSAVLLLVWVLAGCAQQAAKEPPKAAVAPAPAAAESATPPTAVAETPRGKGEQELENGIRSYEDGAYKLAARQLQAALDQGLEGASERARAHKYLAFIHCISGQQKACREEFRKAFGADPKFDLGPAEIGHPMWGPAFRSVKAELAGKARR